MRTGFVAKCRGFVFVAMLAAVANDCPGVPAASKRLSHSFRLDGDVRRVFRGFNWAAGLYGDVISKHREMVPVSHAILTTGLHGDGWVVEYAPSRGGETAYSVVCRRSEDAQGVTLDDVSSSYVGVTEYARDPPLSCNISHIDLFGCDVSSDAALSRMISLPSLQGVALPFVLRFKPDWSALEMAPHVRELAVYNQCLSNDFFRWIGKWKELGTLVLVNCVIQDSGARTDVTSLILIGTEVRVGSKTMLSTFPRLARYELVWKSCVLESPAVMSQFPELKSVVFDDCTPEFLDRHGQNQSQVTNGVGEIIEIVVRGAEAGSVRSLDLTNGPPEKGAKR